MPFSLIKIFLIIFVASHIAIAGPVPDVLGNAIAVEARAEQVSGRSVYSSSQGDSARGLDLLDVLSDNREEEVHPEKAASHSKGEGGPSATGTRHGPENPVGQSASPFGAFGDSTRDDPVRENGGVLNLLSDNDKVSILDILRKRGL